MRILTILNYMFFAKKHYKKTMCVNSRAIWVYNNIPSKLWKKFDRISIECFNRNRNIRCENCLGCK
jgi:hypothetical protein